MTMTGLRRSEVNSLRPADFVLDGPSFSVSLDASRTKNRMGARLPLREDLAADVADWFRSRLSALQESARTRGESIPLALPADARIFTVPPTRVFYEDLRAAGISQVDRDGRRVDIHSLRHSLATILGRRGVPLRTVQAVMRHSDPALTAGVYQHVELHDERGALDALPALRLNPQDPAESRVATGTAGAQPLAPGLAPTSVHACPQGSLHDTMAGGAETAAEPMAHAVTAAPDTVCPTVSSVVSDATPRVSAAGENRRLCQPDSAGIVVPRGLPE
jgi:hypothetical protein